MENADLSMDIVSKTAERVTGWMESTFEAVAQTSVGQAMLKLADRFLWVVEKSAQWSLPYQEFTAEENGKAFGRMELVRPLPWLLFLPGLVILRAIRAGLNVGAFVMGYPQIQPSSIVKCVQKGRRRIRAVKVNAMKSMRRKCSEKDKTLSMNEAKRALIRSIRLTLSTLSCLDSSKSSPSPPPTRIRITSADLEPIPTPDEKSTTESVGSPMHVDSKRKYSELSSESSGETETETLMSRIDRMALEDSIDDPDYNPVDTSTSATSSASSEHSDGELNITMTELNDLDEDSKIPVPVVEQSVLMPLENDRRDHGEDADPEKCREDAPFTAKNEPPGFYSPTKFSQDGDTTFYSPVSSKSASPERSFSPMTTRPQQPGNLKAAATNDFGNGQLIVSAGPVLSGTSSQEVTNGVAPEKHTANTSKSHHKGKRSSHGNRKKK